MVTVTQRRGHVQSAFIPTKKSKWGRAGTTCQEHLLSPNNLLLAAFWTKSPSTHEVMPSLHRNLLSVCSKQASCQEGVQLVACSVALGLKLCLLFSVSRYCSVRWAVSRAEGRGPGCHSAPPGAGGPGLWPRDMDASPSSGLARRIPWVVSLPERCVFSCTCSALSRARLFATLWTMSRQTPLSMQCYRQDYWRGLLFHTPFICKTQHVILKNSLKPW